MIPWDDIVDSVIMSLFGLVGILAVFGLVGFLGFSIYMLWVMGGWYTHAIMIGFVVSWVVLALIIFQVKRSS